jgi:hypothetical protein
MILASFVGIFTHPPLCMMFPAIASGYVQPHDRRKLEEEDKPTDGSVCRETRDHFK